MPDKRKPLALLEEKGLSLSSGQVELLNRYAQLIDLYSRRFNLTRISGEEIWRKHFLDSLLLFKALEPPLSVKVVDVGSGAGLPGVVLKIYRPDLKITLLESQRKRFLFLVQVIKELGLEGVIPLWGRAEEVGQKRGHRESYYLAVARAVAPLNVLAEYCLPLVELGGIMVAYKGPKGEEEIQEAARAVEILGGGKPEVYRDTLPRGGEERLLILVPKVKPTPPPYPRRPGIPEKRPL